MSLLISLIGYITNLLILVVLIKILLSFFLPPYNSIRRTLDQLVDPMLNPIRMRVPPYGMFDFSPIILLILIQLIAAVLIGILQLF